MCFEKVFTCVKFSILASCSTPFSSASARPLVAVLGIMMLKIKFYEILGLTKNVKIFYLNI